jgi:4-amino-4-deoxy-L-arabinose transferase-like glycosyltransferase
MFGKKIGFLFFFAIVVKFILAWIIPVFGDESYYWFWGQHVQLSYFDHPGMVGWLTWLGSKLSFLPISLLVRWPFIFLSTLSLFLFIQILRTTNNDNSRASAWLIACYLLNPLLGVGGILATPDVPLVFFWTLSYWVVLQILKNQRPIDYAYLGISLGLGLCSKYHIVLFPLSTFIGLLFVGRIKEIQYKKIILTLVFGFVFSLPVLVWNYQNNWASFAFQLNHGFQGKSYTPLWTLTYIAGQILLFNPILFYQLLRSCRKVFSKNIALTNWLFFLISSFKAGVEANWPIAAHTNGLLALNQTKNHRYLKSAFIYFAALWFFACILYFSNFGQLKMNRVPNSLAAQRIWSEISMYRPIYGPTYQMSSLFHMISGQQVLKLSELSRIDFYDSNLFSKPVEKTFYTLKYNSSDWPSWLESAEKTEVLSFPKDGLSLYRIQK